MWLLYALLALLFWSGSDIFTKIGTSQKDKLSQWKVGIAVGLVMGAHAIIEIIKGVPISWNVIVLYLPASALYIAAMIVGYVGLRYIELSISSPICNGSGAVACIFLLVFLREIPDTLSIIGIVCVCSAVIALGFVEKNEDEEARLLRQQKGNHKYAKSVLAIALPVAYCFIDAAGTVADSLILQNTDKILQGFQIAEGVDVEELAANVCNVAYELTWAFMGLVSLAVVLLKTKPVRKLREGETVGVLDSGDVEKEFTVGKNRYCRVVPNAKRLLKEGGPRILGGISETVGQLFYIFALAKNAPLAAPIIASYCVLSMVWSAIFLKEKLSWKHYIVIGVTVVGIVLFGISEGLAE